MKKTVLVVTVVSMLGWLTFAIRSSVVEAQTAQGTFTFAARGASTTSTTVDAFSETTSTPGGPWTVDVTKDVDATTPNLHSLRTIGSTITSARVNIGGVTRRFQNGQITNIQSVAAVVPREDLTIVFTSSSN